MEIIALQGPAHLNDRLIASVLAQRQVDPGRKANRLAGGWHSTTQDLADRPGFPELLAHIAAEAPGCRLQYVWTIVNPVGVGNGRHAHNPAVTSFCYYPRDSRAAIVFDAARIEPRAGLLLRFPGALYHSTEPNPGPEDRIVIACDFEPLR